MARNNGNNSVLTFDRTATGNTAPVYTLTGAATTMTSPVDAYVNAIHNELFVVDYNNLSLAFDRTANGNTAPLRSVTVSSTAFVNPSRVFVNACQ